MPFLRYPSISAVTPLGDRANAVPQKSLRILYVDDMPELREVACISLSRDGHSVECAANGALALDCVTADPRSFDLLITDHHMPHLNGLELVMQLRVLNFPGKILVFSSELSREIHTAYERLNVERILYKPVFPSTLRQVLADLYSSTAAGSQK